MKKFLALILSIFAAVALMGAAADSDGIILKGSDGIQVVTDGTAHGASLDIVYPSDANVLVVEYAETFAERLSALLGQEVNACEVGASYLSSAWVARIFIGEEYDNSLYVEYLTAKNGGFLPFMPESEEEWGKYCGTDSTYSMYVDETGLHINASDEWALYWAIDDLLNEIEIAETYVLPVGTKVLPGEDYVFPDPTDLIGKGLNPYFAVTKSVAELPYVFDSVNVYDYSEGMQGGGTDGEFAYIAGDGVGDLCRIFKYSLPEWELVEISKPIVLKHANDISYIEKSDLLTVAHCVDVDQGFSYVDPNTLEVVGVGAFPVNCWGLEYDDVKERFVVEADWKNYIFDKDFNLVDELSYGDSDGTPQSLYIEGEYIFDVRWDMNLLRYSDIPFKDCDFLNYIMIHDYENAYVEKAHIPVVKGEPEYIFRHGNMYYIGFLHNVINGVENPVGIIYRFLMLPEIWWD